jgi:alkaline phosphatase
MVEGGLIDVAHHKNNAKRALEETLEFEKAVKVYINFLRCFRKELT